MPSRRNSIAMSRQEVRSYLQNNSRLILVTNGPRGYPHAMPMNYIYSENDQILLTTFARSQKVRNLQRDAKATLLIESGENYSDLKSVLFYSEAEISFDQNELSKATEILVARERGITQDQRESMQKQAFSSIHKKVLLRFNTDNCLSWDHSKLNQQY